MDNIGICVPHLGPSQLAMMAIKFANSLYMTKYDCTLFYRDLFVHCCDINAGCMTMSEMWGFKGTLITTTFHDTRFALQSISPGKKIFYFWDLEFLKDEKNFIDNLTILRNKDILLAVRSPSHAKAVNNYCNRTPDMIIEDFQFDASKI